MNVIVTFAKMLNKKTKVLYFDPQLRCGLGAQQMFSQKSAWKKKRKKLRIWLFPAGRATRHCSISTAVVAREASPRLMSLCALQCER